MLNYIHHIALPRYSNNFKARLIQIEGVVIMILVLLLLQTSINLSTVGKLGVLGYAADIAPEEVISLTNQKRQESGLGGLVYSETLAKAARAKGLDMLEDDYWAHISPDGTEPWAFFEEVGYSYRYAGENLARDFSNPQSAVEAWMASPSHRDNLLSPKYKEIGVAVVEGDLNGVDTTLIVQLFGTKSGESAIPVAAAEDDTRIVQAEAEVVEEPQAIVGSYDSQAPLVSPFSLTRSVALLAIGSMLAVLIIDLVEVHRKNIRRISSRSLAHLSFLAVIMFILLIAKSGQIL